MSDDGTGEARFSDPPNQTVALPAGTLFPVAIARAASSSPARNSVRGSPASGA